MNKLVMKVHSDNYNVDGDFWLDEGGYYRVSVIVNMKIYTRILDKEESVPKQYISDYAWMTLEDLYEDILLEVAEEEGHDL